MLRTVLKSIHSVALILFSGISLAVVVIISSYFATFSKSKTQPYQTAARIWGRFLLACAGIKPLVSGTENIPLDRAVLFVANHQSFLDDILILACIPVNFRVVIAKEYFQLPVFGWGWRKAGYISTLRGSVASFYQTMKTVSSVIHAGESVLIFPEGTRSRTGKLGEFKRASLLPALNPGAPIVPIAISGSIDVWPAGSFIIRPRPVKFTFGKPIYISSEVEYDRKLEEVRAAISSML